MELSYNIYFELAGTIILLVIFAYLNLMYPKNTESINKYTRMFKLLIIANILDIVSAVLFDFAAVLPIWINYFASTLYFLSVIALQVLYFDYLCALLEYKTTKLVNTIKHTVFIAYVALLIINLFTGVVFYFNDEFKYTRGSLYMMVYVTVLFYICIGYVIIITNRKLLNRRVIINVILFTTVQITGSLLQAFILPNVLITLFTASIAVIVMLFALETPDYAKLLSAMEEIERSKAEIELASHAAIAAKQEAEAANMAKSSFLASMSHEIRTPINGVLGMNSIILKESTDPKILEYARNIDNAGNGLLSIINDILDFSKIESGKMELVPVEYDLSNVLSACYNLEFMRAKENGLNLFFENNTTIPSKLFGDEVRIRQIIVNLLTNAIKYTRQGDVVLTADWEEVDANNMILIISVKDTGIGISEENLEKLFNAFERIDLEKNRSIEGTGLGLRITKQFVDMMNGTITVQSEYGVGSEFTVRIPQRIIGRNMLGDFANYVHISTEEVNDVYAGFRCPKGKVLVVDDVPLNLKVIEGLLKETELRIDLAASGQECLEMIEKETYDVILLDHMMPNMDGIETLKKMLSLGDIFNKRTPVIAMTANAIVGAKQEYLDAGFTDYLSKPVREQELNEMLIKYLPKEIIEVTKTTVGTDNSDDDSSTTKEESNLMPTELLGDFAKKFHFLDIVSGMTFCLNNENFYESVIKEFRDTNKFEEIQYTYDDMDLKNYAILVHGVKSAALTIGATKVSDMAKDLEGAAKSEDVTYIKSNHYLFMRAYGELLDNLDEVYG